LFRSDAVALHSYRCLCIYVYLMCTLRSATRDLYIGYVYWGQTHVYLICIFRSDAAPLHSHRNLCIRYMCIWYVYLGQTSHRRVHIDVNTRCIRYNSFHWKSYIAQIHQIEKLRFLGISRYNSIYEFGLLWICIVEFEFLDLADSMGVAFSVQSVMYVYLICRWDR